MRLSLLLSCARFQLSLLLESRGITKKKYFTGRSLLAAQLALLNETIDVLMRYLQVLHHVSHAHEYSGSPTGNRTPLSWMRTKCPNR